MAFSMTMCRCLPCIFQSLSAIAALDYLADVSNNCISATRRQTAKCNQAISQADFLQMNNFFPFIIAHKIAYSLKSSHSIL